MNRKQKTKLIKLLAVLSTLGITITYISATLLNKNFFKLQKDESTSLSTTYLDVNNDTTNTNGIDIDNDNTVTINDNIINNQDTYNMFYKAVSHNNNLSSSQKETILSYFNIYVAFKDMIDINVLCQKIDGLKIIIDENPSEKSAYTPNYTDQKYDGVISLGTKDTNSYDYKEMLKHELLHLFLEEDFESTNNNTYYDKASNRFLVCKDDYDEGKKFCYKNAHSFTEEAIALLIASEYLNSDYGQIYDFNLSVTKGLCDTFGSKAIIKACLSEEGKAQLYNSFLNAGMSPEDIYKLDDYLNKTAHDVSPDTSLEKYKICEYIIKMNENITNSAFTNNHNFLINIVDAVSKSNIGLFDINKDILNYKELYSSARNFTLNSDYLKQYNYNYGNDFNYCVIKTNKKYLTNNNKYSIIITNSNQEDIYPNQEKTMK